MKNYVLLIFIVLALMGCKKDLTGHWHAQMEGFEYRLDIENNKDCYMISSLSGEPSAGKHFSDEKRIEIYAQSCGVFDFSYELKGDNVFIKNQLNKEIILEERPNCNKIDDFKSKVLIDFLKLKTLVKDSVYNSNLNEYINIGFSKKDSTVALEIPTSYKLQTIGTIDSLTSKIEENYATEIIPFINYILTPDKNIKAKKINQIIDLLNKNGKKKIYIRTLKNNFNKKKRDIFEYIRIKENRFNFNSNKALKYIIN